MANSANKIQDAFKASGYPTREECDDLRIRALADDAAKEAERRVTMARALDEVVAFLAANRDHIAGFVLVAQPFHGDKLVEADRDTTDGRAQVTMISSVYRANLTEAATEALANSERRSSNPLAALLGGLE